MSAPAGMTLKFKLKFISPFPDLVQIKFLNLIQKGFLLGKVLLINGLAKLKQTSISFVAISESEGWKVTNVTVSRSMNVSKGLAPNIPIIFDGGSMHFVFV